MDVNAVRTAISNAIASGVTGLSGLNCFPYVPDDAPTPFAYVQVDSIEYDKAMRGGSVQMLATVLVMMSRADDLSAQAQGDALMSTSGTSSVKAAIQAANGAPGQPSLGGAADFVHVVSAEAPRWYAWRDDTKYYGVSFKLRILGTG